MIDWLIPSPRAGWRGIVDRFFGPGQMRAEIVVQLAGGALLGALVAWSTISATPPAGRPWWGELVLIIFACDAIGGVLTNSTGTAKRWYHRPGTRLERLGFVGLHVAHLLLLSTCALGSDWQWFSVNLSLLLPFAAIIEYTPLPLKRPVATGLTCAAILVNSTLVELPSGLAWIPLLLYIKLLLAHMTPEAPFRASQAF